jgi:hypothetical protein
MCEKSAAQKLMFSSKDFTASGVVWPRISVGFRNGKAAQKLKLLSTPSMIFTAKRLRGNKLDGGGPCEKSMLRRATLHPCRRGRARPHRSPPVTTTAFLETGRGFTCGHTPLILAIR